MDVGSRIKQAREAGDMSQAELGERLGVARATVSRWESNERELKIGMLTRIASATDKELHFFFEDGKDAA